MRVAISGLLLCSACFSKPAFDGGSADGGVDAPVTCTTFTAWSQPRRLDQIVTQQYEYDPALDRDATHLVYVANHRVASDNDLYLATWNGTTYANETLITTLSTGLEQYQPSWSFDDRYLYYWDDGTFSASPVTAGPTFGQRETPADFAGIAGALERPRYARGGTIMAFWHARGSKKMLAYATRTAVGEAWTERTELVAALNTVPGDLRNPTLTEDGLTVVFEREGFELYVATRSSVDVPFASPAKFDPGLGSDDKIQPELARDGTRLVFTYQTATTGDLYLLTRACAP
jgi:hypothetical protein